MKRVVQISLVVILILSSAPGISALGKQLDIRSQLAPLPPGTQLFLPVVRNGGFSLTGLVTDSEGQPLGAVTVTDQHGHSAVTGVDGRYTLEGLEAGDYALAPSKPGYVFSPSVNQVNLPGSPGAVDFYGFTACSPGAVNGGFELNQAWDPQGGAGYTAAAAHSGARSFSTGILQTGNNESGYSFARQTINVPAGTAGAILRLWLYPLSEDAVARGLIEQDNLPTIDTATASNDAQYLVVRNNAGDLLETLLWMRSDNQSWSIYEFNLTKYAGQTIQLEVGSYNDGLEGVTAMYVDDVSLELCSIPPPIIEEPTQPMVNYFGNSGFEVNGSWTIAPTAYPAAYSTFTAHTGVRSMRTGIIYTRADTYSYSDAYQTVTIPSNATSVVLDLWIRRITEDSTTVGMEEMPANIPLTEAPLANDRQYILVLDQYGNILDWLLSSKWTDPGWVNRAYDLTQYKGRTIRIQFGTYNDGIDDVTTMFVDDAVLDVIVPAPTTTPVPSPSPTPPPGTCTEKFGNTGFEANSDWGIPITAFTAGYSTRNFYTGLRSMRTGIIFTAHNRYSYSDAYQTASISSSASSATLGMWLFPISERATDNDLQYVLVLDRYGNWIDTLFWQRSNSQTWTYRTFNLNRYRGMTVRIQFGVYNDGLGDVTTMYVDDASLQVCP
jgi:hypothetical protein